MSINSTTRKAGPFTCTGAALVAPFSFKVFTSADILVVQTDLSGVESTLALTTNYTVALNANQNTSPGGTVTVPVTTNGYKITISSQVSDTQPTSITNGGGFYPTVIEDSLDRATIQIQQLEDKVSRSVKVPISATFSGTTLPTPVPLYLIGYDASGTTLTAFNPSSIASVAASGNWSKDTFTGDGSTKNFTLSNVPGSINNTQVYVASLYQRKVTDYTLAGAVISFVTAPPNGVSIEVVYASVMSIGIPSDGSVTAAKLGAGAVTSSAIAANAVTSSAIAANAVTSGAIAAGAATLAKLDTTGISGQVLTAAGGGGAPTWSPMAPKVRQTVVNGAFSSSAPACLSTGAGLAPALSASSTPLVMTFASGYNQSGNVDLSCYIAANNAFPSVPASNTSFLYANRVDSLTATLGSTLAPPQYGYAFTQSAQSKLDLNNNVLDDFGNTWSNTGVTFTNTSPMISGTYMGVFNGSSAYANCTTFTSLGQAGWTIRLKVRPGALPSSGNVMYIADASNGSLFGAGLTIYNNAGTTKFAMFLSSNGSAYNIANGIQGTTTPVIGSSYDLELTYDALAITYRLYVNGVQEASVGSSLPICTVTGMTVGKRNNTSASYFQGWIQGFEFLPYCLHPAGTSFTPPTVLANVATAGYASDWYSIVDSKMYSVTSASGSAGANPGFTQTIRLYLGECVSGASTISSVTAYAYNGAYDSGLFSVSASSSYSKAHNMGTTAYNIDLTMADDFLGSNERPATPVTYSTTNSGWAGGVSSRNVSGINTSASVGSATSGPTTFVSTAYYRLRARRAF